MSLPKRSAYWSVALCCAVHPSSIDSESFAVIFTCAQWNDATSPTVRSDAG